MLRKPKWQILAARYNWCQGLVAGRGPAVEKHWHKPTFLLSFPHVCPVLILRFKNFRILASEISHLYAVIYVALCSEAAAEYGFSMVRKCTEVTAHCVVVFVCLEMRKKSVETCIQSSVTEKSTVKCFEFISILPKLFDKLVVYLIRPDYPPPLPTHRHQTLSHICNF
jgi:hypothetical protein